MTPRAVAEVLRRARREKEMTQFTLAEAADVSKNTIINFERGHHYCSLTSVVSIATALGYELRLVRKS